MSEIKPWIGNIGKHEAYMIMCDVLNVLCEKEAIKKTVYERLRQAPSTDRKGHWIIDGHHMGCSQCGMYMCQVDREGDPIPRYFCPNCGADMRGEQHE